MKRNINVTFIVINNLIFALTQGQTSPTSPRGLVSISHPYGSPEHPLDGLRLALAAGATFIARGFSGEPAHLASLLKRGIRHKGFSLIEVLSPCVTYNKVITYQWFKNNIERLDQDSEYNPKDIQAALDRTHRGEKIPVGLVFQQKKPSFESLVYQDEDRPLVSERLRIKKAELKKIMDGFE
jgi:2-oxoglutarate ferredoxin oxidoreductase subunit beta